MTNYNQSELVANLEHCKSFKRCSQNLCPLDYELDIRVGRDRDKCRYMREPRKTKVRNKTFVTGGKTMPDEALKFVPKNNVFSLNTISRKRWKQIKHKSFTKAL